MDLEVSGQFLTFAFVKPKQPINIMLEITYQNVDKVIEDFDVKKADVLRTLLDDVYETNKRKCVHVPIAIGVVDEHTDSDEYPDMYGSFKIYAKIPTGSTGCSVEYTYEPLSLEGGIDDIDTGLCPIVSYFEALEDWHVE